MNNKFQAQHVASNLGLKCCKSDSSEEVTNKPLNIVKGSVNFKLNNVEQKSNYYTIKKH